MGFGGTESFEMEPVGHIPIPVAMYVLGLRFSEKEKTGSADNRGITKSWSWSPVVVWMRLIALATWFFFQGRIYT